MKKYLFIIIAILLVVVGVITYKGKILQEKYDVAVANVKAYEQSFSNIKEENYALQLTAVQMQHSRDSVIFEMDSVRNAMGIKIKNLKAAEKITSTVVKTDTVMFRDTIFKNMGMSVDTALCDDWYNLKLKLYYPNSITVSPKFKSKKYLLVHTKKETINPPKRYWIQRLFQKKHKVVVVDVVEENPYTTESTVRYVEVVK